MADTGQEVGFVLFFFPLQEITMMGGVVKDLNDKRLSSPAKIIHV